MKGSASAAAVVLCLTLVSLATAVGVSAADESGRTVEPSPSPDVSEYGSTIADAFPEGIPVGAVIVDVDTLAFDNGAVLLNVGPTALSDCPSNWVCLWQDSQYSGRMLQFQQCCQWQNLADYGFANKMSSWANKRDFDARWAFGPNGGGTVRCMDSHSSVSYVGNPDNDQAESIRILDTDTAC